MLPNTPDRVPLHTGTAVNRRIQQKIAESVRWHARHPERIDQRLRELDAEWDIERTLEANAATIALTGTLLGIFVDRRFLVCRPPSRHSCSSTPPGLVSSGSVLPQARGAHHAGDRRGAVRAQGAAGRLRPDRPWSSQPR